MAPSVIGSSKAEELPPGILTRCEQFLAGLGIPQMRIDVNLDEVRCKCTGVRASAR